VAGTFSLISAFIFLIIGVLEMISTFMMDRITIPLVKVGTTISSTQSTYVNYKNANRVGIYL